MLLGVEKMNNVSLVNGHIDKYRPSWNDYFMKIAELTASRSTCFSESKGAVITKNGRIIATGYSGAPSGVKNCLYDIGFCNKRQSGYGHGEGHDFCLAVHAEANAILSAANIGIETNGATIYCTHFPCINCAKMIINCGIKKVYYKNEYKDDLSRRILKEANVEVTKI